jgi:hypothetical protein
MLKSKELPGYFLGEAVTIVVHVLNRSPTRIVNGKMAYEVWHGEAPTMHYFRMFGCLAHVKITYPGLQKLDDRSHKTIFVRYEAGSKVYRCYDHVDGQVMVSHGIVFYEVGRWSWHDDGTGRVDDTKPFVVEYTTETVHAPAATPPPSPRAASTLSPPPSPQRGGTPVGEAVAPVTETREDDLDADHDDAPFGFDTSTTLLATLQSRALRAGC